MIKLVLILLEIFSFSIYTECNKIQNILVESSSFLDDLFSAANEILISERRANELNFIIASNNSTKHERSILINDLILKSSSSYNFAVYVEHVNFIRQRHRFFNVFIVDDFKSFYRIYKKLSSDTFVIDGFYLVIFITETGIAEIERAIGLVWRLFVYNIDFLIRDRNGVNLMTFLPFSKCDSIDCQEQHCGSTKPIIINQYVNASFQLKRYHFPEKLSNLFQCPVKVVTFNCPPMMMINYEKDSFELRGVDGEMMTALAKELNFKINLIHISDLIRWGSLSPDGTATGAMQMVINNEVDLTVGMYTITYQRSQIMTSSEFYYSVPFILIVPPGSSLTSFEKLFRPFQINVWLVLLFTFVIAIIVITVIKLLSNSTREFVFGRGNRSPFLNVLIGFIGGSQKIVPHRNFARTLLMMYLLFCLVKRSLYQGALFQFLQTDERHSEIESIDELVEAGFEVYMLPSSLEHTQNMKFKERRRAVNSTVLAEKRMKTLNPLSHHAVSSSLEQILYYNKLNYKNNTLTVCREHLFTFQYGIYFRKNSYLVKIFNKKISLFKASGLIDFWSSEFINNKYLNMRITSDGPKQLNIEHLLGSFEILGAGTIIAFVIFLCEVITMRFKIERLRFFFEFFV